MSKRLNVFSVSFLPYEEFNYKLLNHISYYKSNKFRLSGMKRSEQTELSIDSIFSSFADDLSYW
jgi:hypothetical protein